LNSNFYYLPISSEYQFKERSQVADLLSFLLTNKPKGRSVRALLKIRNLDRFTKALIVTAPFAFDDSNKEW